MREIYLTNGEKLRVYDTSGVYTDPTVEIDVEKGITPIRKEWIEKRGDTEEYEGRVVSPRDNGYAKEEDLNRGCCWFNRAIIELQEGQRVEKM